MVKVNWTEESKYWLNYIFNYQHSSKKHIRIILHGHYRIAYLYREKDNEIDVLGVFHGKMEIRNNLRLS